jgi:ABC-2 type transport system ATP-binding protein
VALLHEGELVAWGSPRELKTRLRGAIVELRPDQPRQAAIVLREQFTSAAVNLFGNRVHLLTRDPGRDIARATAALRQRGLTLPDPSRIEPSLEDVFLSLVTPEETVA